MEPDDHTLIRRFSTPLPKSNDQKLLENRRPPIASEQKSGVFLADWLAGFAYRVAVSWWFFVLPTVVVVLIALITISQQTLRAATRNPVDSLRDE